MPRINIMIIASFDIGIKNFAYCVEEFDQSAIPKRILRSFKEDGTPTDEYQQILDLVYRSGRILDSGVINLDILSTKTREFEIYSVLTQFLDSKMKLWDNVDIFLIEQQMAYGSNANIKALRVAQHCISYLIMIYGTFKKIMEFSSSHKTRVLGCPSEHRSKYKLRKHFSVCLAEYILSYRQDEYHNIFTHLKKKDDVADCILMIQAYKIKFM